MPVTTIRSLAAEIGISYWQVRHVVRMGYVTAQRPARRKWYLTPEDARAIKAYFGQVEPATEPKETRPESRGVS
ncbi:MAG TPA: hypothetical protein VGE74_00965 [Gemmata sp.]